MVPVNKCIANGKPQWTQIPENLRKPRFIDVGASRAARKFVSRQGLVEGRFNDVQVNRWTYGPDGSRRSYDIFVNPIRHAIDGSVTRKALETPQIRDLRTWKPTNTLDIIRPVQSGNSYRLLGARSGSPSIFDIHRNPHRGPGNRNQPPRYYRPPAAARPGR